jgi:hypothetical protein
MYECPSDCSIQLAQYEQNVEENIFSHFRLLCFTAGWHRTNGRDTCCGLTGNKIYPTGKGIPLKKREKSNINIFS